VCPQTQHDVSNERVWGSEDTAVDGAAVPGMVVPGRGVVERPGATVLDGSGSVRRRLRRPTGRNLLTNRTLDIVVHLSAAGCRDPLA
jgi:hypothetical protein